MQLIELHTETRLSRLERLIKLYQGGHVSTLMDRTLDKLFSVEAAEAQKTIDILRTDLDELEARYGMESSAFFERFDKGEMGDAMDFIEWASLYRMYMRASKRLELLTGEK